MDDRDDLSCGEAEGMDQGGLDGLDLGEGSLDFRSEDLDLRDQELDLGEEDLDPGEEDLDLGEEDLDLGEEDLDLGEEDLDLGEEDLDLGEEDLDLGEEDLDSPEGDMEDLNQKLDDIHFDPDFQEWSKSLEHLDDQTLQALWKDVQDRSPREVELVDAALHPEYESQKIFLTNETGKAMQDEQGNWITETHRISGSQAPDGFFQDPEGVVHLREQKNYTNASNLMRNITEQTASRRAAFGDDVDITYTLAPNFTVQQAEKIQAYCEDELGVSIEWQD